MTPGRRSEDPSEGSSGHGPHGPVARAVAWTLATWFGCGRFPVAPGTMGTLGAVPLYLLAARCGPAGVPLAALLVFFAGVWAAGVVSRQIGRKDPSFVVVDEVAGYLVAMLPAPHPTWVVAAAGFALFRLFDILKPGPVRWLERLPGGWGIVLDDVAAGALAALVLLVLRGSLAS